MTQKDKGGRPTIIFYDEAGDVRLMSEAERLAILKAYNEANIKDPIMINTSDGATKIEWMTVGELIEKHGDIMTEEQKEALKKTEKK